MAKKKATAKRRNIRFTPDLGDYALISFDSNLDEFEFHVQGLILNESSSGCAVVLATTDGLKEGDECVTQIGRMDPMISTIIWRKDIDPDVIKIGLKYEV